MRTFPVLIIASTLWGCTTTFHGSSKVERGPAGCKQTCDEWGMDLAGMVKMGEYSDGCICQVKPARLHSAGSDPGGETSGAPRAGGTIPAAAGVYMQMQAAAAAAAQQSAAARRETESSRARASPPRVP
jgi:hypothetical protein